jgi:hypothetical protein
MTNVIKLKAPATTHNDPADQYGVVVINGPHANDPGVLEEHVTCLPIERLDRELQPGDWVHARLRKFGLVCDVVRKVIAQNGHLALTPLRKDTGLEDIPIDKEVEIKGFVVDYFTRHRR